MATVGSISVEISANLAPLRKAQSEAKKIMGEFDKALSASAKTVDGAFGTSWAAQVGQFNASAKTMTGNVSQVASSLEKVKPAADKASKSVSMYNGFIKDSAQFSQQAAFQFNDLFVQLASGQSAFTAITQQGAQLSQMFAPGTGIGAAAAGLKDSFVQFLINPLNLAVVGIAAVAAAIPTIWNAVNGSDGKKAEEVLNNVNDVIKEIEKNSPNAAEAVQRIMNAASGNNTLQAQLKIAREELDKLMEEVKRGDDDTGEWFDFTNRNLYTLVSNFGDLGTASARLRVQLRDALNANDITKFRDILSSIINDPSITQGIPVEGLQKYAAEMLKVSDRAFEVEKKIKALGVANQNIPTTSFNQLIETQERLRIAYERGIISLDQYKSQLSNLETGAVYQQEQAFKSLQEAINALNPGPAKASLQEILDKAEDGKISSSEMRTAIEQLGNSFDTGGVISSIQGVAKAAADAMKLVQDLRTNGSVLPTLGTLSPLGSANGVITSDQIAIQNDNASRQKSQYQLEQERLAKRGGGGSSRSSERDKDYLSTLQSETQFLQQQLNLMGMSYDERQRALQQLQLEKSIREGLIRLGEKATPAQKAAVTEQITLQAQYNEELRKQEAIQQVNNDAMIEAAGLIGTAINGAITGTQDLKTSFLNLAVAIAKAAFQAQLLESFSNGKGGLTSGGSLLSALFGGLAGARADGGPVSAGSTYLVGERGPELFTANKSGVIVPNHSLASGSIGGGGSSGATQSDVRVWVDQDGNWQAAVERIATKTSTEVTQQGFNEYNRALPYRIKQYQQNPNLI